MKKSCDKFLPRFDDFVFFVTDSKIHHTLNFYLKSTKANRLAKVIRVLSGKFTESCTTLLHRARLKRLHKYIQNTHSKLVLTHDLCDTGAALPVSQRSWVRFPFKPEFFQVSSFQPLKLKNLHCDDLHIILSLSALQYMNFIY